MGLDMYLSKKTYIGNHWETEVAQVKLVVPETHRYGQFINAIKPERISEIVERVGYWRKANHIHAWFVKNVQDGRDECQEHYCTEEKLQELLDTVNTVLADHSRAEELLPTQDGFFFGNTDYDEYYFKDLEHTKEILETALKEGGDFYYHSSW